MFNITFRKAVKEDADILIKIYNDSFYDDYIKYGECPGYGKTREQMENSIQNVPKHIILKDEIPIGVLSFEDKGEGKYYLGCLCVIPEYQGSGIGTQAFEYMLSICPQWTHISLVTPADKEKNIRFYTERCGFSIDGKEMDGNVEVVHFRRER